MNKSIDFLMKNIEPKQNIVLAISGGPDSMVMFDLFLKLRDELELTLVCAHVNHSLREESKEEDIEKLNDDVLTMKVTDKGIGIEDIEKAKEPLFTTRLQEERAGLGFTIMEVFSDNMEVISEVGVGTTIICKKKLVYIEEDE